MFYVSQMVYRELSEVKGTVEGTLSNGRRLVKEQLTSQPHTLSTELDALKALYNKASGAFRISISCILWITNALY